jgi:hypothetical protein
MKTRRFPRLTHPPGRPTRTRGASRPVRARPEVATGPDDQSTPADTPRPDVRRLVRPKRGRSTLERMVPRPRLFTATIAYSDGGVMIQAFHASVAIHPAEVVQKLRSRFGDEVLAIAELRAGFHPASPIVISLVPPSVADMIRLTERNCEAPAGISFTVDIEQRIEI